MSITTNASSARPSIPNPTTTHDYRDIGGRVTPGAVTEEARAENESGDRVEEAKAEQLPRLRAPGIDSGTWEPEYPDSI